MSTAPTTMAVPAVSPAPRLQPPPTTPIRIRVRRARMHDVHRLALACSLVFGELQQERHLHLQQHQQSQQSDVADRFAGAPNTLDGWTQQIAALLALQAAAAEQARARRVEALERSEAAAASAPCLDAARCSALLLAECAASGEVLGTATLALAPQEARLPLPQPHGAPAPLAYVCNTAVLPAHRRRGVATALLRRCEALAGRWAHRLGQPALWLHVDADNAPAAGLYGCLGFQEVAPATPAPAAATAARGALRLLRKPVRPFDWSRWLVGEGEEEGG